MTGVLGDMSMFSQWRWDCNSRLLTKFWRWRNEFSLLPTIMTSSLGPWIDNDFYGSPPVINCCKTMAHGLYIYIYTPFKKIEFIFVPTTRRANVRTQTLCICDRGTEGQPGTGPLPFLKPQRMVPLQNLTESGWFNCWKVNPAVLMVLSCSRIFWNIWWLLLASVAFK